MISQTERTHNPRLTFGDTGLDRAPFVRAQEDVAYVAGELSRQGDFAWLTYHLRCLMAEMAEQGVTHVDYADTVLQALGRCMTPMDADYGWASWRVAELLCQGAELLNDDCERRYGVKVVGR